MATSPPKLTWTLIRGAPPRQSEQQNIKQSAGGQSKDKSNPNCQPEVVKNNGEPPREANGGVFYYQLQNSKQNDKESRIEDEVKRDVSITDRDTVYSLASLQLTKQGSDRFDKTAHEGCTNDICMKERQKPTDSGGNSTIQNPSRNINEEATKSGWMDVCYTKAKSYEVKSYFNVNERLHEFKADADLSRDLEFVKKKIDIVPGASYKFRVAAVNSCGRGPWSEISAYTASLPGFPGTPSAIKISKTMEGAVLVWEPPPLTYGNILEYSVYLAIKPDNPLPESKSLSLNVSFVRIYCGSFNQCAVSNAALSAGFVDTKAGKSAIVFRIAAKNDKGYGPATQVRWLQETAFPNFNASDASNHGFRKSAGDDQMVK